MNTNDSIKNIAIDFNQARLKHLVWKTLIWDYLKGITVLTKQQAVSEHECDLGIWLYEQGMKKYGTLLQMQELEKVHASLHATIKKIIHLFQSGNQPEAIKEATQIETYSQSIINLLNSVEKIILESHPHYSESGVSF